MKVWKVVDVNGDDNAAFGEPYKTEDEAEMWVERAGRTGDHVVEVDTVKEAAEEMLAALKQAVPLLIRLGDFIGNGEDHPPHGTAAYDRCAIIGAAKDVIEKAEGRR